MNRIPRQIKGGVINIYYTNGSTRARKKSITHSRLARRVYNRDNKKYSFDIAVSRADGTKMQRDISTKKQEANTGHGKVWSASGHWTSQ